MHDHIQLLVGNLLRPDGLQKPTSTIHLKSGYGNLEIHNTLDVTTAYVHLI